MKNLIWVSFLMVFIGSSCSKSNEQKEIKKCECQNYPQEPDIFGCSGILSSNDTCQTYFKIWKELFLEKNQMTEEYFNNHITPCKTNLHTWKDGVSFEVYFKVKIGWVETTLNDDFVIWLSSSAAGLYPTLNIPGSVLLSKEQIRSVVNNYAFSSRIFNVSPISNSKYNSQNEAMKALIEATGVDTLCNSRIYYEVPNKNFHPVGHPYIKASCILNQEENKCVYSQMDLYSGEVKITYDVCWIMNK